MPSIELRTENALARTVLVATAVLLVAICYFSAKWGFANTAALRTDVPEVAELSVSLSPTDPAAHLSLARALEGSFEPAGMARSLKEYEIAASLRPHDYALWLALGRARERDGDRESALLIFREAASLAPNYSRVHWALGNALLRSGNVTEGFAEIRTAFANDDTYVQPAVTAAAQFFDGNSAEMIGAVGSSETGRQGVIQYLTKQGRLDEAFAIWKQLPSDENALYADKTSVLASSLYQAGRFRDSLEVIKAGGGERNAQIRIGSISNGSFETNVKAQDPEPFAWRIGTGVYPQVAITEGEKRDGRYSLLILFNSAHNLDLRPIDQTIAVEPGASYTLKFSYRSDLTTNAEFAWEVAAADKKGEVIASSAPLDATRQWTDTTIHFTAPANSDGITIRMARRNCTAPQCSITGNLWFDSFDLRKDGSK